MRVDWDIWFKFFIPEINNITSPLNTNQPPLNFSEKKSLVTNGNSKGFYCRRPENIRYEGNVWAQMRIPWLKKMVMVMANTDI